MPLSCNPLNEFNTPHYIKIIYNKVDKFSKETVNDEYNEIHDTISNEFVKGHNLNRLFDRLSEIYKKPSSVTTIKYIFIGHYTEDIQIELDKIEKNKGGDVYDDVKVDKLHKYFNYEDVEKMKDDWQIDKTDSVRFVPFYISKDEKIAWLFNILGTYLDLDSDIFKKNFLYIYSDNINAEEEVNNIINSIKKNYISNEDTYTFTILEKHLKQFLIPDKIIQAIKDKHHDIHNINSILDEDVVKKYLKLYLKHKPIGYEYIIDDYNYPINSYIFNYANPMSDSVTDITLPAVYFKNNDQYLINYFLPNQDTLYLYNFHNLANTPGFFDRDPSVNIYKLVIKKLFPQLDEDCLTDPIIEATDELVITTHSEQIAKNKELLKNYNELFYAYINHINYVNLPGDEGLILDSDTDNQIKFFLEKEYLIILKHKFHIPSNFDFKHIFNNLKLDLEIPFVKFKDVQGTREILYKLFKPISDKKTYKYDSVISKDTLDSWIRYKGYEMVDQHINKLKLLPKEICYKIRIDTIKDELHKFSGRIFTNYDSKTYDIEYSTGSKMLIFPNIPHDYIEFEGDVKVNTNVKFYKPIYIYADLELSNKGYMKLTIDIEQYNNCIFKESSDRDEASIKSRLTNIGDILNKFIERVCLIDILAKYKPLNLYDSALISNNLKVVTNFNNYSIDNMIYKYSVKIPKNITVTYEYLYKAADMLHPFIFINENPYNIGDSIQYYETDTSLWINGIIKSYSVDNTYSVALYDEDLNETSNRIVNSIDSIFIRRKQAQSHIFEIIYKRVNEFDTTSPIINIIKKLLNIGLGYGDILYKLVNTYNINHNYAVEMIKQVNKLSGMMTLEKIGKGTGVAIKIDYNKRVYTEGANIDIYLENVTSENDIKNIYNFLNFYFSLYLRIVVNENIRDRANVKIFDIILKDEFDTTELKTQAREISKLNTSPKKLDIHGSMDVGSVSSDDELEDVWSDDDDEEEVAEIILNESIIIKNISDIKLKQEMLVNIESDRPEKNKILRNLYDKDPILFNWKLSTDDIEWKKYPRASANSYRYPKVITDDEKQKIDYKDKEECMKEDSKKCNPDEQKRCDSNKKHCKSSYQTQVSFSGEEAEPNDTNEILECTHDTPTLLSDSKCNAIKYGSGDEDSYHWYICPKIIELNTNMTLTIDELDWDHDGDFISKYDDDLKKGFAILAEIKVAEKVVDELKKSGAKDASAAAVAALLATKAKYKEAKVTEWRTHAHDRADGKKDILDFKPHYKNYYPIPNGGWQSDKATARNSLWFLHKMDSRSYPGFLTSGVHPLNISTPSCFEAGRGRAAEVLSAAQHRKGDKVTVRRKASNWNWQPGKILKNNPNGTHDVKFDAGNKVLNVPKTDIKKLPVNNYIQSWGNFLNEKRLGLLPPILKDLNKSSKTCSTYKTGDRSILGDGACFLREGVSNNSSKDNFFDLLLAYKPDKLVKGRKIETMDDIKQFILLSLDEKTFKQLNNGNLPIKFENKGIIRPFQNYLEYIISSQRKYLEYFYEFLTSPDTGIFTEKIKFKLLVLDYTEERSNINLTLRCFDFFKATKIEIGDKIGICIYHTQRPQDSGIYEIIGLYKKSGNGVFYYNSDGSIDDKTDPEPNTNRYIKQLIDDYNKQCCIKEEEPSNLITQAKLSDTYIIKEKIDIESIIETIREKLKGYVIKHYIEDTYGKIIGIIIIKLSDDKTEFMIPVYPQIKIGKTEGALASYAYYESLNNPHDGLDKIPTQTEWYSVINRLKDKVLNTYIKHIRTVKAMNDEIIGIIIASGHYIKLKEFSRDDDLLPSTYIEPYKIDHNIDKFKVDIKKKSYKKALTKIEIIKIIGEGNGTEISVGEGTKKEVVAIKYNDIYIPVDTDEEYKLPDKEIVNYDNYIKNAIQVSQLYSYKLNCLPVRGYMKMARNEHVLGADAKYTHIILETGLKVKLDEEGNGGEFKISKKIENNSLYKIEKIIEDPIIEQIFGNIIPDHDSSIQSNSFIKNDKINYKGNIKKILKLELYLLMRKPEFSTIKQELLKILESRSYSKFTKKIFIWPVMDYILDLIIEPDIKANASKIKYPKLDIENACNNTIIQNEYCTEKQAPPPPQSTLESSDEALLIYIKEAFSLCHKESSDSPSKKKSVDYIAVNKHKRILERKHEKKVLSNIYDVFNRFKNTYILELKKLKIIILPLDEFINKLKSDIINDIIYNKYRRNEIFTKYTNTDISNKYKVNEPHEHIISHYDYNLNILEALYRFKRQQYYNENIPFDLVEYNPELHHNISKSISKSKQYCQISSRKTKDYILGGEGETYKIAAGEEIKNDKIKKLDVYQMSKLYNLIYSTDFYFGLLVGCERASDPVASKFEYTSDTQKLNYK